jgi:hypothetical protein
MHMLWLGWNTLLALPMRLYHTADNVLAVSGRCRSGHQHYPKESQGVSMRAGRCGVDINKRLAISRTSLCTFHIRDTVNRGPLLYNATKVSKLGYFDEVRGQDAAAVFAPSRQVATTH